MDVTLRDDEFSRIQKWLYNTAGINLSGAKKALVRGRLSKRLRHLGLSSYGEYFTLLESDAYGEVQTAVDLLTTNETCFFREPKHFEFFRGRILPAWRSRRRLWSAACSSGEEVYTLAMVCAEHSPTPNWEIVGTDISTRMLEQARSGLYPIQRAANIPKQYLHNYCLRGIGGQDGSFKICHELRSRLSFMHANLKEDLGRLGSFDVIFLRNVLIYFDIATKKEVVSLVIRQLKPGGHLMVGHSESLNGVTQEVNSVVPTIYQKPRSP